MKLNEISDAVELPRGVKVIIGFHVISFLLWSFGQTGAVLAYDTVAEWGFQDPRALIDPVIVEVNRAIGLADTLVMLPLFVVAVVGLLRRRFFGAVASWLVFGMTLYWPTVFWCSQFFYGQAGIRYQPTPASAVLVPAALMLVASWGSWYLASRRQLFS
jgi:hypothetical protein